MIQLITMTTKIRTFLCVFKNSLVNFDYYREVLTTKFSFSLKYFYGLLVVTSFISFLPLIFGVLFFIPQWPATESKIKTMAESAYPANLVLTVKDGQLSTNVREPYYVDAPGQLDKHLVAIDTKGSADDYVKYNSYILLTKKSFVSPKSGSNSNLEIVPLADLQDNITVNQDTYIEMLGKVYPYFQYAVPLLWGLAVFLLTVGPFLLGGLVLPFKLLHLLIFSVVAHFILLMAKKKLSYVETYKMALHASTLPIIFFTLLAIFGLNPTVPFGYSIVLAVFMLVIFLSWKKSS